MAFYSKGTMDRNLLLKGLEILFQTWVPILPLLSLEAPGRMVILSHLMAN